MTHDQIALCPNTATLIAMTLRITNRDARRLLLDAQGLSRAPTGPLDLSAIIRQLGFVQLDTIRIIARAHHHILWSRNQNYREPMLGQHMSRDRQVFEHFTHDASVLPMDMYPMWQRQFRRMEAKCRAWDWHRNMLGADGRNTIKDRIRDEGPLCTKAFNTRIKGKRQMWRRPPHKLALDYMWYAGELSTSHRQNFRKFYDLSERVIPDHVRGKEPSEAAQIDWLCRGALDRLAFGTEGDIQKFWAATDLADVKTWACDTKDDLVLVEVETAEGQWRTAWAPGDIESRLANTPAPTSRLRIINPFDPIVRDRTRLAWLFGFDYKIEIFIPAAKRRWGYYVYPILEGGRFVGRIEVRGDRKAGRLDVLQVWPEPGVKWTSARANKLDAELARMARFIGVDDVVWP